MLLCCFITSLDIHINSVIKLTSITPPVLDNVVFLTLWRHLKAHSFDLADLPYRFIHALTDSNFKWFCPIILFWLIIELRLLSILDATEVNSPYARIRHDQWLPRCRSTIGIGNVIVGSFLLVLNSMASYAIWNMLCNLISE